jgi:hypothetical protein
MPKVKPGSTTSPTGYSPGQIRHAYEIDQLSQSGSAVTIAIVDAYDDPNVQSDLPARPGGVAPCERVSWPGRNGIPCARSHGRISHRSPPSCIRDKEPGQILVADHVGALARHHDGRKGVLGLQGPRCRQFHPRSRQSRHRTHRSRHQIHDSATARNPTLSLKKRIAAHPPR